MKQIRLELALVLVSLAAIGGLATAYVNHSGWTLYYGDAEAHLDIARRIVDSRQPGYEQIGTVWLPLPHLLMLPLVRIDRALAQRLGGRDSLFGLLRDAPGVFLYAAMRRAAQFIRRRAGVAWSARSESESFVFAEPRP